MAWFRKSAPADPLAVTMTGVTLGNRIVVLGLSGTKTIAALAAKAGLTGQAVVLDDDEAKLRAAGAAIEREGGLVELTRCAPASPWPYEDEHFDVAVLHDVLPALSARGTAVMASALREVFRTLRPGGRAIVIDTAPRRGLSALVTREPAVQAYASGTDAVSALKATGFAAVRVLAEQDGATFIEGVKRSLPPNA
jgi:ubiquinone/menaquinone biosynthesis C-methylase UbiE